MHFKLWFAVFLALDSLKIQYPNIKVDDTEDEYKGEAAIITAPESSKAMSEIVQQKQVSLSIYIARGKKYINHQIINKVLCMIFEVIISNCLWHIKVNLPSIDM